MKLKKMTAAVIFQLIALLFYGQTYLSRNYTVTDGMASPTIIDIAQDPSRTMWFATPVGVTSYDGTTWRNYSFGDGLPTQHYFKIRADKQGKIWVFTRYLDDGIYLFEPAHRQWQHIRKPSTLEEHPVPITAVAMMENTEGVHLGVGTREAGFYVYSGGSWQSAGQRVQSPRVLSVDCDNRCFYLITGTTTTRGSNLQAFHPERPQMCRVIDVKVPAYPVCSIRLSRIHPSPVPPDKPGSEEEVPIWLTGIKWAGYYFRGDFHLLYRGAFPGFRDNSQYQQILTLPDPFGGLWAGNNRVIFNIDRNGVLTVMGMPENLPSMGAYALLFDRESNLWIGNHRGIVKITSFRFENYRKKDGLFDSEVTALSGFGQGGMVFGHNGGFTFLTRNRFYPVAIRGGSSGIIFDKRVLDLCTDNRGNTWAAVVQKGIARINPQRQIMWCPFNALPETGKNLQNQLIDRDFSAVLCDRRGQVWASARGDIYKWDGRRFIPFETDKKIGSYIRRFFPGPGNTILIATGNQGLYRLEENRLKQFCCRENEDANSTYAVYTRNHGNVLVGTQVGLYTLEKDRLVKFNHHGFRIDIPVYFITEDRDGFLWFGLNNGVIKWDGSDGSHARHYTLRDGLAGNETNRGASFLDPNGRLWIGTEGGVSCYYPERDMETRPPPSLELLDLETSGRHYPLDRNLSLKFHQRDLSFHFRSVSFIDETATRFNLKLEGFDREWLYGLRAPGNQMRYLNVPPGSYRFYAQAVNGLGEKSPILSSGRISIEKPFFRTGWFYLLLIALILLLIFLIANFISRRRYAFHLERQIRQRTSQLEASEKELKNIFNNAHDAILVIDPDTEVVQFVNQRGCEIYGFSREEFVGMSLETISKDVQRGKEKIRETLQAGDCLSFETVQYRKDGSEMFLEINASLINYRGKTAILSINRDSTQRKLAELQIKKSLQEKEILLKEIHHRVKNNLQVISSLLDLQADTLEDPEILNVFKSSKDRIRSMALVHENLYQFGNLARIDGIEYVRKLVEYFFDTYGDMAVSITPHVRITPASLSLDMDTAIPLGLILTELLTNALKHAFPSSREGEIHIGIRIDTSGMLILEVHDNGIGFPRGIDLRESKSLGMQLVTLLTQQVKGTLKIEGEKGTTVTVSLPLREKK